MVLFRNLEAPLPSAVLSNSASAAANGGERPEQPSPSHCSAEPTALSPDENRNLNPEESGGTKKSQTLVDPTAGFALFPLPERTAWLSSKKRACVRGVCYRACVCVRVRGGV